MTIHVPARNEKLTAEPRVLRRRAPAPGTLWFRPLFATGLPLRAWLASVGLHSLVFLLLYEPPATPIVEHAPIRVVLVDPAPPPPGLPEGRSGDAPALKPAVLPDEPPDPALRPNVRKPPPVRAPVGLPTVAARPKAHEPRADPPPKVPAASPAPRAAVPRDGPDGANDGRTGGISGGAGKKLPATRTVAEPPVVLHRVAPEYPRPARSRSLEGEVVVAVVIDRRGRIEDPVEVIQSVPGLDAAAVDAVRRWKFRPARNGRGETVRARVEVPFRFELR